MSIELSLPVVVLGLALGTAYGLLGAGLVLIHRISGVLNFAIGAAGALGAAVVGYLVVDRHMPYWLAFPAGLAAAAAASVLTEAAAVRRLSRAPQVMSVVATLGMAAFLSSVAGGLYSRTDVLAVFPSPPGMPTVVLGELIVTPAFSATLILSPALVVAGALFLRLSRTGTALRATAANGRLARTIGISTSRMAVIAWGVAGAFAGVTTILGQPLQGFTGASATSPDLLLHALAAATLARLRSLPVALAAGVAIGVAEQQLEWNQPPPGTASVLLFALIAVGLLLQRRPGARKQIGESWSAVLALSSAQPAPDTIRRRRWASRGCAVAALVGLALLPQVLTTNQATSLSLVFAFAIIALGVLVVTGMSGHLSLGHMGFAAVGAVASFHVVAATDNFVLGILAAGAAGAVVAAVVGIPALRVRGVMYAVATLGFGLAVQEWLLPRSWAFGEGVQFPRPAVGTVSFMTGRAYYEWALIVLVLSLLIVARVRRTGLARTVTALRDNEDGARVFTVPVLLRTVQVFLLGGFLAGVGGAVLAHGVGSVTPSTFDASLSLSVVAAAVIGGLGFAVGPLLGALFVVGVPLIVPLDSAVLAGTALGWLLLVVYVPSGFGAVALRLRDQLLERLGVLAPAQIGEPDASAAGASLPGRHTVTLAHAATAPEVPRTAAVPATLLDAAGIHRRFGGLVAVDDVSLQVRSGEIVGIIGANGAGKTTLFEIVSGFTRPHRGTVEILGRPMTHASPRARSRLGLVRSFQDAKLFPTLTVHETVTLAHERHLPSSVRDLIGFGGGREDRRRAGASDLLRRMGLEPYAHKRIAELSTGTRRITELACMLALQPKILLLDEPSAGIAQSETEALVGVLRRIHDDLDVALVIVEHDVPLVLALATRVVAMESGRIIADGDPHSVVRDPAVMRSYLGDNPVAANRSAPTVSNGADVPVGK